jgi:hypothetical protein
VGFRVGLVQVSAATGNGISPIELTFTQSHGFTTGQSDVVVADVPGNTAANGTWTVTVTANNKVTLNGSTGNGDYIKGSPNGGTATDNGTHWIQCQCLGTESALLTLGNDRHPDILLDFQPSDIKNFGDGFGLNLRANAPADGQVGFVIGGGAGGDTDRCFIGFDPSDLNKLALLFPPPVIRWAGGSVGVHGGSSAFLPAEERVRDAFQTTDGNVATAHTISASASSMLYAVTIKVVATRIDTFGDFATFLLKGNWLNSSGMLVADAGTPFIVEGQPTDSNHCTANASSWTATLAASGTNILLQVKGETGKTIRWSIVREQIVTV